MLKIIDKCWSLIQLSVDYFSFDTPSWGILLVRIGAQLKATYLDILVWLLASFVYFETLASFIVAICFLKVLLLIDAILYIFILFTVLSFVVQSTSRIYNILWWRWFIKYGRKWSLFTTTNINIWSALLRINKQNKTKLSLTKNVRLSCRQSLGTINK